MLSVFASPFLLHPCESNTRRSPICVVGTPACMPACGICVTYELDTHNACVTTHTAYATVHSNHADPCRQHKYSLQQYNILSLYCTLPHRVPYNTYCEYHLPTQTSRPLHTRSTACTQPCIHAPTHAYLPDLHEITSRKPQSHITGIKHPAAPAPIKRNKTHSLCAPQQHTLLPQHHDKDIGLRWMR